MKIRFRLNIKCKAFGEWKTPRIRLNKRLQKDFRGGHLFSPIKFVFMQTDYESAN